MKQKLAEEDPLLRRGIESNWVCVVSPASVSVLRAEMSLRAQNGMFISPSYTSFDFSPITGRRTWVIPEADAYIAYMPPGIMYAIYAEYFRRNSIDIPVEYKSVEEIEPPTDTSEDLPSL